MPWRVARVPSVRGQIPWVPAPCGSLPEGLSEAPREAPTHTFSPHEQAWDLVLVKQGGGASPPKFLMVV